MPDIGGAGLSRYDVIIVGGGPGGTSAANHLIQRSPGSRVALVERLEAERFSHYHHMCGEGISKSGLKEIGHDLRGVIEQDIDTVVEHWPGGRDIEIGVKGAIIDRALLLDRLRASYEREGGTVMHDSVVRVIPDGPGFEVHLTSGQTISTTHLIGADGAHSKVRSRFFPELVPDMIWADQFLLDAPTERGVLHFHYDERYGGGYRWVFPAKVGSRVGFPRGADPVPPEHLERHRRAIPVARAERLVNGRCCLVGDAACQVNAISFGGIRTAMVAGRMAAEAIAKGDLSSYERHWSSSPYAKASDMGTHARLRSMSNQEMIRMTEPFRDGYGSLRALKAMLFSSDREIYRSFWSSGRYGW
jgi:digeranylgeranylglycerophospholipid reductase